MLCSLVNLLFRFVAAAPLLVCHVEQTWDGAYRVRDEVSGIAQQHYTVCFVSDKDSVPLTRCDEVLLAPAGVCYYKVRYPIAFVCGGYRDACFKNFMRFLHEDNPHVWFIPLQGAIY